MFNKIRSNKVLSNIFGSIKNRMKMKIVKYNKNVQKRLNIYKEDYEKFVIIKEFNTKYNLNLNDIDEKVIDLHEKNSGEEILKYMNK